MSVDALCAPAMPWAYDDGGRAEAGYKGKTGDCVVRAIAICEGDYYQTVYDDLFAMAKKLGIRKPSPREGVSKKVYEPYLLERGWTWHPTMKFGQGVTVHVRPDELPREDYMILRLSRHLSAVVDGVVRDTHDPSRNSTRAVYGYWRNW